MKKTMKFWPMGAMYRPATFDSKRIVLTIPGKDGWDVIDTFAKCNNVTIPEFARETDAQVYCDHIMIDAEFVAGDF